MTFKVGDKVKIVGNSNSSCNKIGDIGVIASDRTNSYGSYQVEVPNRFGGNWTRPNDMVLVEDDTYEDGWILNDGKVTIPDDAQKSMHEGSVVAFRKRKPIVFNFGDYVKSSRNPVAKYIFIKYNDYDKTKCIVACKSGVFDSQSVSLFTKV